MKTSKSDLDAAPCCPDLQRDGTCDRFDFVRVLQMPLLVPQLDRRVIVRLYLHFRIERCPGPLLLGDPAYSTTLLPGEKVRLFVMDRRNSFTFDSATRVAYRHQHMSEDQYYMRAVQTSFGLREAEQTGRATSSESQRQSSMSGEIDGGLLGDIFGGPSFSIQNSSFSRNAVSGYLNRQRSSFFSADSQAVAATRLTNSVSVGEVSTRTHVEGSSEEHFESSSREFSNPNRCHAVTYIFYRLNKQQTVTFSLVNIERDVLFGEDTFVGPNPDFHEQALEIVDRRLAELGIFTPDGEPDPNYMSRYYSQRVSSIPTPGIIVKGCLDECDMCEGALEKKYQLENEMFKKQIELLEKSQEYRCCPCENEVLTEEE
jgi:hypothetical protein